jgi:hypothetical protein
MKNIFRSTLSFTAAILSVFLLFNQFAHAATLPRSLAAVLAIAEAQAATTPSQISTAHTVFIANAGAQTGFPYNPDTVYAQFSAALTNWGHYTVVTDPSKADLILQLRDAAPIGGISVNEGTGSSYRLPELRLSITDPHTQVPLWSVAVPVYVTLNKKDHTDYLALAVTNLTSRVKLLTGAPITASENSALNQTPKAHGFHSIYLLLLIPILLGVVAVVLAKKHSDDFKNDHGLTCSQNPLFC